MTKRTVAYSALILLSVLSVPILASDQESAIAPEAALKLLQEGNHRLAAGHALHPHTDRARIADVAAHGQHPFATVVACSDSRVPVELIFDEGFGDLFVIRVAGNVCDVDEVASIEYGVGHLGTPLLVVMGHSHCGAVTAVATDEKLEGSIPRLVDNIRPAIEAARKNRPEARGKELIATAVKTNVWQGIEDLLKSSTITRERCQTGKLKVVGALYHLETGQVEWLGEHPRQAELLKAGHRHAMNKPAGQVHSALGVALPGIGLALTVILTLHSQRPAQRTRNAGKPQQRPERNDFLRQDSER